METQLMRIGVSLPGDLLENFDEIILKRGYSSRSEGIRDAIRTYNQYYEWMQDIKGRRASIISMIYDFSKRGVPEALATIQHEYLSLINSSIHFHIDPDSCFEIIILDGEGEKIVELAEKILSLKGVKYMKLATFSATQEDKPLMH